jgi:hypothetical protein
MVDMRSNFGTTLHLWKVSNTKTERNPFLHAIIILLVIGLLNLLLKGVMKILFKEGVIS